MDRRPPVFAVTAVTAGGTKRLYRVKAGKNLGHTRTIRSMEVAMSPHWRWSCVLLAAALTAACSGDSVAPSLRSTGSEGDEPKGSRLVVAPDDPDANGELLGEVVGLEHFRVSGDDTMRSFTPLADARVEFVQFATPSAADTTQSDTVPPPPPPPTRWVLFADSEGRFEISKIPADSYRVGIWPPEGTSFLAAGFDFESDGESVEQERYALHGLTGALLGEVVGLEGESSSGDSALFTFVPVADAMVGLYEILREQQDTAWVRRRGDLVATAVTDAEGRFEIWNIPSSDEAYALDITPPAGSPFQAGTFGFWSNGRDVREERYVLRQ